MKWLCWLALLLCGCGGKSADRRPEVRIAATLSTYGHLPVHLAQSLGYFEQEGVKVSIASMPSSAKVMEAVVGGSVEVGASSLEQSIQMAAEGRPVQSFVLEFWGVPLPLVVSPKASKKIGRMEDLRGAKFGISSPGSQSHFIANHLLASAGVASGDFTPVAIGFGATNIAALEHGRVDAALTSPAGLVLLKRRHLGLTVLYDPPARDEVRRFFGVERYPSHVLGAPLAWVRSNPETARKLSRAVLRALSFIRGHSAEELAALLPKEARTEDPSVDVEALSGWLGMYSTDGAFSDEGFEAAKRVVALSLEKVRSVQINRQEVYTNEFVREAK